MSVTLSTRAAGVPFINVLHSTTVREYYETGLQSWPDRTNCALFRWLFRNDEETMNRWMSNLVLKLAAPARPYNAGGSKYGVPKFNNFIEQMKTEVSENMIATGFLPEHKVNPMADISVIHGGQNSVMSACLSGTPVVGIGMHPGQQESLDACVRKGFAIRLNKRVATASDVLTAIEKLLHDKTAKESVEIFRKQLADWDGPENAARFLKEHYGLFGNDMNKPRSILVRQEKESGA